LQSLGIFAASRVFKTRSTNSDQNNQWQTSHNSDSQSTSSWLWLSSQPPWSAQWCLRARRTPTSERI
jgi:hypothetical protein